MTRDQIEQAARDLQLQIWRRCPSGTTPYMVADPKAGIAHFGFNYLEQDSLGRFGSNGSRYEVAGSIDRSKRLVLISDQFSEQVKRFTAAHELAHLVLHPGEIYHRDRPIEGMAVNAPRRSPIEKEADYFAGCYLIPRKLLLKEFRARFGLEPFIFNDDTAWHLGRDDPESLLRAERDSLSRATALATARSFNGQFFSSLTEAFGVSVTTMALRIEDLGLIRYP